MSIPEFNDLFHNSGAQGILDFLLSKLEANNLSPDEALAMLSAVHEELGEGSGTDPKVYQSYNGLMKLLQREKPEVYEYVVSAWNQRNKTASAEADNKKTHMTHIDEFDANLSKSQSIEEKVDIGFEEVKVEGGESDEAEESQESVEIEEKETTQVEKIDDDGEELRNDKSEEETKDEEDDKKEANGEDLEKSSDEKVDDRESELETDDPKEEEIEKPGEESETDEKESGVDEEAEPNEVSDESITESDKGETEGEAKGEQGETEWPEVEVSPSEEPLEGLQNEDGSSVAED